MDRTISIYPHDSGNELTDERAWLSAGDGSTTTVSSLGLREHVHSLETGANRSWRNTELTDSERRLYTLSSCDPNGSRIAVTSVRWRTTTEPAMRGPMPIAEGIH